MKNFFISALIISAITLSCASQTPGSAVATSDSSYCSVADTHMAQLCKADPVKNAYCCQVDAATKKGLTYTDFCTKKQAQGVSLNPKCLAEITSCDQINACTNSK